MARPRKSANGAVKSKQAEEQQKSVRMLPRTIAKTKRLLEEDSDSGDHNESPKRVTKRLKKAPVPDNSLRNVPDLAPEKGDLEHARTLASLLVSESEIYATKTPAQISRIIHDLTHTQQDRIFEKYKRTAALQRANDSRLIELLRTELASKQDTIDVLTAQLRNDKGTGETITPKKTRSKDLYESPIRKSASSSMISQEELANEMKTIGITLDMLELLTGVRIVNYEEDKDKFYFDVKQSSTNMDNDAAQVSIDYQLIIKRKFEQSADVNYVPLFLKNKLKDATKASVAKRVTEHLPAYLHEDLLFPYNTLLQFYAKISKALNKTAKA